MFCKVSLTHYRQIRDSNPEKQDIDNLFKFVYNNKAVMKEDG